MLTTRLEVSPFEERGYSLLVTEGRQEK